MGEGRRRERPRSAERAGSGAWSVCVALWLVLAAGLVEACAREPSPPELAYVLVAAREIPAGKPVTHDDFVFVAVPGVFMERDAHGEQPTFLGHREHVVGHVPVERILPFELLQPERFAHPADGVGLHRVVPQGLRAVAVPVRSADPALAPGCHVDALVDVPEAVSHARWIGPLLLITMAEPASPSERGPVAILLGTPAQAEALAWPTAGAPAVLELRYGPEADPVPERAEGVARVADLLRRPMPRTPEQSALRPVRVRRPPPRVRVIRDHVRHGDVPR